MPPPFYLTHDRKSQMHYGEVYFWTSTIKDWHHLLAKQQYKQWIIDTLQYLTTRKKIKVYAFVIMPNHIHLVWQMLAPNGKESPKASFQKFTAHQMLKDIKAKAPYLLKRYKVEEPERNYRVWQKDPLAVYMDVRWKVEQKIDYIHRNPLQKRWLLADSPEDYYWSSAHFYATEEDRFGFLVDYREVF